MQYITGRIVILENKKEINKPDGSFLSLILVIKKKMNGKLRNIAFKCYGRVAEKVCKLRMNDKVEIEYFIYSKPTEANIERGGDKVWFTNLQAKNVDRVESTTKNDNNAKLNFDNNDTT